MRLFNGLILLFLLNPRLYAYVLTPTGAQVEVEYDEPTVFVDSAPLTNLGFTTILFNIGKGSTTAMNVPATRLQGGGHIVQVFQIPVVNEEEKLASVWATATSTQNIQSGRSNIDQVLIDRVSPQVGNLFASITGNEFEVTYKEPILKSDGTPLTDLAKTTIYYDSGLGPIKVSDILASGPNGGGQVVEKILVPIGEDTEQAVSIWCTATDLSDNESIKSPLVVKRLDRLAPGGIE